MYLMIDHYDSFVYNLTAYLRELGQEILVLRSGDVTPALVERLRPEGIILSPGPGRPGDAVTSCQILRQFSNEIPILGVCLGHQMIGAAFGAKVCKGERPMHGKVTPVRHNGEGLFRGLPQDFQVTRYHSLVVSEEGLPDCLRVDAWSEDGAVMGISHKTACVYGVQFHPEAVLTEYGHELLKNFQEICEEWWWEHASYKRA
ncbi:MAG: aminodeoxychorismate/anthranilate synthase component II [Eubacteriales bacterium]|nr:aminodeoxychorismate/anthranilate synthase component II [Eubacteriales bacterium]